MQCKNEIKIGATLLIEIQRVSNNVAVDITDTTIESFISHPKFGQYELDVEIVEPTEGKFRLILDADTTSGMLPGEYIWDMSFTDPDGNVEIFPKNENVILKFCRGATVR